jgi:hypothetical protein
LIEQALMTALLEPAPRVAIAGGEERGSWLLEQGVASARAFAFGLVLTRDATGAMGRVGFAPSTNADETCPALESFTEALAARQPMRWTGAGGNWTIDWS